MDDMRKTKAQLVEELARLRAETACRQGPEGSKTPPLPPDLCGYRFLERLNDGFLVADATEQITYANPHLESMLGYRRGELTGRNAAELFPRTSVRAFAEEFLRRKRGREGEYTIAMQTKDGRQRTVRVRATPLVAADGGYEGSYALVSDITPQATAQRHLEADRQELDLRVKARTAELMQANEDLQRQMREHLAALEALSASESRYRLLMENADAAIFLLDEDLRFVDANRAALESLGYSLAELKMLRLPDVETCFDPTACVQALHGMPPGMVCVEVGEHRRKDGATFPVEVRTTRLESEEGPLLLGMARDMTEPFREREELRRAKEAAEHATQAKGEMLATFSHEVRTPIAGIMGVAELAMEHTDDLVMREYLGMVREACDGVVRLTTDLLDLSKMEAGRLALAEVPFDLEKILNTTLAPLALQAGEKGLLFLIDKDPELPRCLAGDGLRLSQVVTNLVSNAVKFTQSGEVCVRAAKAQALPDVEDAPGDAVWISVTVTDTGPGIAPEHLDALFTDYTQLHEYMHQRRGDRRGSGLGLAITRRLAALMGGGLKVSSEPGKGSAFTCTLPFAPASPEALPRPRARKPTRDLEGLRVLLAEDNPLNRLFLSQSLVRRGVEVRVASDGRQALAMLEEAQGLGEPFQAVIMDVEMPEMDGLEAVGRIRTAPGPEDGGGWDPGIPVIALSAHAMPGDRERFLAAGMTDYLAKPVSAGQVLFRLAQAVYGDAVKQPDAEPQRATAREIPGGEEAEPEDATKEKAGRGPFVLDAAVLDSESLERALADDPGTLREMLVLFLQETEGVPKSLNRTLAAGLADAAARMLHGVANTAGAVRAGKLQETAMAMEQALRSDRNREFNALRETFAMELARAREAAREYLSTL